MKRHLDFRKDFRKPGLILLAMFLVGTGFAFNMGGSGKTVAIVTDESPNDSLPPYIHTKLPVFPFEVLYVVTKEYESVEDGSSLKQTYKGKPVESYTKERYVELRLMDLYPGYAYSGVAEDSRRFYDTVTMAYSSYCASVRKRSETIDGKTMQAATQSAGETIEETLEYVSEENEVEVVQMTENEQNMLENYNNLARGKDYAMLSEILGVAKKQNPELADLDWMLFGFVCLAPDQVCSHLYYRIMLCKIRAESAAEANYPSCKSGEMGDAFRHVAVSMMLRRYLSEALSYMVMDLGHERVASPNVHPCDTYMDLHNNRVGRSVNYQHFRGDYQKDCNDWRLWLSRIKEFIDNEVNAEVKDWSHDTPKAAVRKQRKATKKEKYIIFCPSGD